MSRSTQGFTLIELMVVVVMIAIVATIAIPSYQE
ncbi:MAG: prepilin-type N-terminal cleavage/methylation domain-containing protein, partial [Acinetobacter sp.]